jgi:hypothetical protein
MPRERNKSSRLFLSIPLLCFFVEGLEGPEDTKSCGLCQVRGTSDELDDDNSLRTGVRQDSGSDVSSMRVEKKYNRALVLHSLPPSFNPQEENRLQPVGEQNFCHKGFRGRSNHVIVPFMHFEIRKSFFLESFVFRDKKGRS